MLAQANDMQDKEIRAIRFTYWPQTPNDDSLLYDEFTIKVSGVTKICEHYPQGAGDRWFYDVYFDNGRTERIFNVSHVFFSPQE